jgi:hypothetical protein
MTERTELYEKRSKLIADRDEEIEALKSKYADRIDEINEQLRRFPKPAENSAAINRYLEPENAPSRYCNGCGAPLLRATIKNAEEVLRVLADDGFESCDRPVRWSDVRTLTRPFCCHLCKEKPGHHSRLCTSATEHEIRMKELKEIPEESE